MNRCDCCKGQEAEEKESEVEITLPPAKSVKTMPVAKLIKKLNAAFSRAYCKISVSNGRIEYTSIKGDDSNLSWDQVFSFAVPSYANDTITIEVCEKSATSQLSRNSAAHYRIGSITENIRDLPCVGRELLWTLRKGPRRLNTRGQLSIFTQLSTKKAPDHKLHIVMQMEMLKLCYEKQLPVLEPDKQWKNGLEILPNAALYNMDSLLQNNVFAGVPYEDEEDSKRDDSSFVNQGSDKRNPPENSAVDSAISVVHEENSNRQPNVDDAVPPPACTCTYTGLDDDVIAYYGTDILEYGQQVKKNETVEFQCRRFGFDRLNGKKEITCEDCRPWHSAEYPRCVAPARGDAILGFPDGLKYLPGNTVVIEKGAFIKITCRLNEFPNWAAPNPRIVTVKDIWLTNGYRVGELFIYNIREEHNGQYECYWYTKQKKVFNIQVKVPTINCSKFDEREFHIHYDKLQAVNSSASFSCKDENKKVVGPNVLTCLIDGRWSGNPPRCQIPSCTLDSLFRIVPENVVPVMDNVTSDTLPFNYTLQLTCEGGLRISGIETATCGSEGWQISRVQCVAPAVPNPLKTKAPELLVEPDKDFYRFGESVTSLQSRIRPQFEWSSAHVFWVLLGQTRVASLPKRMKRESMEMD
ncbi:uncharacterized protein CDAR_287101 [Caerostris darwini]|uniref:Locomotion-related protein Hikaru genki n=1 Tax=Caerostris darwini TaxID=1538125 RepID=A0AAV4VER6_9ARAC|nr:uncharacterized protein CDAR_287101 [Caerostris darwini]